MGESCFLVMLLLAVCLCLSVACCGCLIVGYRAFVCVLLFCCVLLGSSMLGVGLCYAVLLC